MRAAEVFAWVAIFLAVILLSTVACFSEYHDPLDPFPPAIDNTVPDVPLHEDDCWSRDEGGERKSPRLFYDLKELYGGTPPTWRI